SGISSRPGAPSGGAPMIGGSARPSASRRAPPARPWLDSTRPIAARVVQLNRHPGLVRAMTSSALPYAWCAIDGIPVPVDRGSAQARSASARPPGSAVSGGPLGATAGGAVGTPPGRFRAGGGGLGNGVAEPAETAAGTSTVPLTPATPIMTAINALGRTSRPVGRPDQSTITRTASATMRTGTAAIRVQIPTRACVSTSAWAAAARPGGPPTGGDAAGTGAALAGEDAVGVEVGGTVDAAEAFAGGAAGVGGAA